MSYREKVEKHLAVLEDDEREFHVAFRKYLENYFTGIVSKYASSEWQFGDALVAMLRGEEVVLPTHHLDTGEMVFCFCFGKDQKHHYKNCIKRTLEFINEPQWKYNNYVQDLRNKILLYCL